MAKSSKKPDLTKTEIAEINALRKELDKTFALNDFSIKGLNMATMATVCLNAIAINKAMHKARIPLLPEAFNIIERIFTSAMLLELKDDNLISSLILNHDTLNEWIDEFFLTNTVPKAFNEWLTKHLDTLNASDPFSEPNSTATDSQPAEHLQGSQLPAIPGNISELTGQFKTLNADSMEYIADFLTECYENVQTIEEVLLMLEENPTNQQLIDAVFRAVHTIKGSSSYLQLTEIATIAHWTEFLLDQCRSNERQVTSALMNIFLQVVDIIKSLLANIQMRIKINQNEAPETELPFIHLEAIIQQLHDTIVGDTQPEETDNTPSVPLKTKKPKLQKQSQESTESETTTPAADNATLPPENPVQMNFQSDTIRIPVARVDVISEIVGELLISLSLLRQSPEILEVKNAEIQSKFNSIQMTTDLLYSNVLKMRMFPIKPVYDKLNRQIRDLIQKSGKKVDFITEGGQTEVDKGLIDEIGGPLTHMIRNSVDHALESPEERLQLGKPETGKIVLKTENRSNAIIISIQDDGRGLNREKILQKAIDRGLVTADSTLSDAQVYDFIFHPGFSTADKITEISGRGVGMDVVKKTVESFDGALKIFSKPNEGTRFEIHLPLSASILEGLIVSLGTQKYIFPLLKVKNTVTAARTQVHGVFEDRGAFILYENRTTPIIDLNNYYAIPKSVADTALSAIIVCERNGQTFGLMVDEIHDQQKIVTKALDERFKDVTGIKAGTILGDGSIGLIIEPEEIIQDYFG